MITVQNTIKLNRKQKTKNLLTSRVLALSEASSEDGVCSVVMEMGQLSSGDPKHMAH